MMGKVEKYNDKSKIGYIKGYDDVIYLYRKREVDDNIILKEGDIVKFEYIRYSMEEMPMAIEIQKKG